MYCTHLFHLSKMYAVLLQAASQDYPFHFLECTCNVQRVDEILEHSFIDSCCFLLGVFGQVSTEEDNLASDMCKIFGHVFGRRLEVEVGMLDFVVVFTLLTA